MKRLSKRNEMMVTERKPLWREHGRAVAAVLSLRNENSYRWPQNATGKRWLNKN